MLQEVLPYSHSYIPKYISYDILWATSQVPHQRKMKALLRKPGYWAHRRCDEMKCLNSLPHKVGVLSCDSQTSEVEA